MMAGGNGRGGDGGEEGVGGGRVRRDGFLQVKKLKGVFAK
jgi:hypothetical protein